MNLKQPSIRLKVCCWGYFSFRLVLVLISQCVNRRPIFNYWVLCFCLLTVKFIILLMLGRFFKLTQGLRFSICLFVGAIKRVCFCADFILKTKPGFSMKGQLRIDCFLMVTLSMAISPLLLIFNDKALAPILSRRAK
jgi:hypothetical protein